MTGETRGSLPPSCAIFDWNRHHCPAARRGGGENGQRLPGCQQPGHDRQARPPGGPTSPFPRPAHPATPDAPRRPASPQGPPPDAAIAGRCRSRAAPTLLHDAAGPAALPRCPIRDPPRRRAGRSFRRTAETHAFNPEAQDPHLSGRKRVPAASRRGCGACPDAGGRLPVDQPRGGLKAVRAAGGRPPLPALPLQGGGIGSWAAGCGSEGILPTPANPRARRPLRERGHPALVHAFDASEAWSGMGDHRGSCGKDSGRGSVACQKKGRIDGDCRKSRFVQQRCQRNVDIIRIDQKPGRSGFCDDDLSTRWPRPLWTWPP